MRAMGEGTVVDKTARVVEEVVVLKTAEEHVGHAADSVPRRTSRSNATLMWRPEPAQLAGRLIRLLI